MEDTVNSLYGGVVIYGLDGYTEDVSYFFLGYVIIVFVLAGSYKWDVIFCGFRVVMLVD